MSLCSCMQTIRRADSLYSFCIICSYRDIGARARFVKSSSRRFTLAQDLIFLETSSGSEMAFPFLCFHLSLRVACCTLSSLSSLLLWGYMYPAVRYALYWSRMVLDVMSRWLQQLLLFKALGFPPLSGSCISPHEVPHLTTKTRKMYSMYI